MSENYLISSEDKQDLISSMEAQFYPIEIHLGPSRRQMWLDMINIVKQLKPVEESIPATTDKVMRPKCSSQGPFSGEVIRNKMMELCGCIGQYDCDCVSIRNKAIGMLYHKHNSEE